uniref:Uncharacterized protein n=1 Tax=Lotharella globosa TaxID=91324 RepID=A0A7S3YZP7_9EUKA
MAGSAARGEEAIWNFIYGLLLSAFVAAALRALSKFLDPRGAKETYGFFVDCILFDDNEGKVDDTTSKESDSSTFKTSSSSSSSSPQSGDRPLPRATRGGDVQASQPGATSAKLFSWLSDTPSIQRSAHLISCALGLIIAFLIYGVQQEKIMTADYNGEPFREPNFLIFGTRFMASMIAIGVCLCKNQLRTRSALYKFSFCSISNILSSFCQFTSLQFLSFPVLQVAKSCKTLAVLLVSFMVLGKRFPPFEYAVALIVMIGAGAFFYIYAETTKGGEGALNWPVGLTFLVLFILLDGFTNVWQGFLSKKYKTVGVSLDISRDFS